MPLRRADRLFDIIRILRAASQPVTAAAIADELEVTVRTVYRDVATLQARRSGTRFTPDKSLSVGGAYSIHYGWQGRTR